MPERTEAAGQPVPMPVYRAPMRARSIDTGKFEGAIHTVRRSLAGIGEPLKQPPADLPEAVLAAIDEFGDKAGRMIARFAELPESSLLWTRTGEFEFRLGKLQGPWRYDVSDEARQTGIHQVRPARWLTGSFDLNSTPRGVIEVFDRGGLNLQQIHDADAERISNRLWLEGDLGGQVE